MGEPVTFFITWSTDASPFDAAKYSAAPEYVHSLENPAPARQQAGITPPPLDAVRKTVPLLWPGPVQLALAVLILVAAAALAFHTFKTVPPAAEPDTALWQPLDLNSATEAELRLLPGIGPKLAQRIIEHRQRIGKFRSVDDLQTVAGIGPVTLARLRLRVMVEDATADSGPANSEPRTAPPKAKPGKAAKADSAKGNEIIDINRADAAELRKIPGIGPVISQNIVDYRAQNGPFRAVEDLCKVRGIKSKTLEKIKPYITLDAEFMQIANP